MYTTQTYLLMQICQYVNSICEYKPKNIQLETLKRRTSHTFLIKKKQTIKEIHQMLFIKGRIPFCCIKKEYIFKVSKFIVCM